MNINSLFSSFFSSFFSAFYWNPAREFVTIPFLDRPIMWYGVFFVMGFILGYFLVIPMFSRIIGKGHSISNRDISDPSKLVAALNYPTEESKPFVEATLSKLSPQLQAELENLNANSSPSKALATSLLKSINDTLKETNTTRNKLSSLFPTAINPIRDVSLLLVDRLCWFVIIGTLVGARLGLVFFYDWPYFSQHPMDIIKVWEGGLASHGGVIGVILSIICYYYYVSKSYPSLTLLSLVDIVAIPGALEGFFIRIGNFFNQEIIGTPTNVPWAVVFGNPADGSKPIPRHPVVLYEALAYFLIFILLYALWKKRGDTLRPGILSGLLLILVFSARFFLEFFKSDQHSSLLDQSTIQMGQYLSIPFVLLGFLFYYYGPQINRIFNRSGTQ